MFEQPPSLSPPLPLPLRAAIASLLGGLFGVALILATHTAQAQAPTQTPIETPIETLANPSALATLDDRLKRLGEAALQALRGGEPIYGFSNAGARFARLNEAGSEPENGLRWQVTRLPGWRSEGEIPRSRDLLSLGLQVRF